MDGARATTGGGGGDDCGGGTTDGDELVGETLETPTVADSNLGVLAGSDGVVFAPIGAGSDGRCRSSGGGGTWLMPLRTGTSPTTIRSGARFSGIALPSCESTSHTHCGTFIRYKFEAVASFQENDRR